MRVLFLLALLTVGWLLYKLYFRSLLAQGRPGQIKLALIVVGILFLGLAILGRAPAMFAVLGAAMTLLMRFAPLLVRLAPWLARWLGPGVAGAGRSAGAAGGPQSQVRTASLLMTLDHATGSMDGQVLAGEFVGIRLATMTNDELARLHAWCRSNDSEALRLLEAYLVRERGDEWRGKADSEPSGGRHRGDRRPDTMSAEEAREILALPADADRDTIIAAHRSLMTRVHPDKGGSTWLAARINEARARLLKELD